MLLVFATMGCKKTMGKFRHARKILATTRLKIITAIYGEAPGQLQRY